MKAFQEIEQELTRLRLLEPQLLKRITELERENKELRRVQDTCSSFSALAKLLEKAKQLNAEQCSKPSNMPATIFTFNVP